MRKVKWRAAAWAALVVALVAAPAFAAPPAGRLGQTGSGNSASTRDKLGFGNTTGRTGTTGNTGNGNATGNGNQNAKNKQETPLRLLHDARHELAGAHFDYDGHKARALKDIERAIRELAPPNPNPPQQAQHPPAQHQTTNQQAVKPQTPKVEKPPQTQAESDAKLQEALRLLNKVHGEIQNADAGEEIAAAIGELKAALAIR